MRLKIKFCTNYVLKIYFCIFGKYCMYTHHKIIEKHKNCFKNHNFFNFEKAPSSRFTLALRKISRSYSCVPNFNFGIRSGKTQSCQIEQLLQNSFFNWYEIFKKKGSSQVAYFERMNL